MKKVATAAALTLFAIGPAFGSGAGCDYGASSASAEPPAQLASTPAPAASKAPASTALAAPAAKKTAKKAVDKTREPATDAKVAVASTR